MSSNFTPLILIPFLYMFPIPVPPLTTLFGSYAYLGLIVFLLESAFLIMLLKIRLFKGLLTMFTANIVSFLINAYLLGFLNDQLANEPIFFKYKIVVVIIYIVLFLLLLSLTVFIEYLVIRFINTIEEKKSCFRVSIVLNLISYFFVIWVIFIINFFFK